MRWLLGHLASFLLDKIQRWLDPEYAKRVNDYSRQLENHKQAVKQAEIELGAIDTRLSQTNAALENAKQKLAESESTLNQINKEIRSKEDEIQTKIDAIDGMSDDNVIRADFSYSPNTK